MSDRRKSSQRYLSGRSKIIGFSGLSSDRHLYVEPGQVEPNLGFPGEKNLPLSDIYYKLVTIANGNTFDRYWQEDSPSTLEEGISIFDEGTLVGTANSVSKINFVGSAITAIASGSISTITVSAVSISTEAPSGAKHGDLWWDSDDGELNVYYQDVNSAQWVVANSGLADSEEGETTNVGITTNLTGSFIASAGSPSIINTYSYNPDDIMIEYSIFIKNGSNYHSEKLYCMRDGTSIDSTEYVIMFNNIKLATFDAIISGSNILLRAIPETGVSGSTTYRIKREVS